jgi:hypothetical protein
MVGMSPMINIPVAQGVRKIRLVNPEKEIDVRFDLNFSAGKSITIGPKPEKPEDPESKSETLEAKNVEGNR